MKEKTGSLVARRRSRRRRWVPILVLGTIVLIAGLAGHDHRLMPGSSSQGPTAGGNGGPPPQVVDFRLVDASTGAALDKNGVRFDGIAALSLGGGRFAARVPYGSRVEVIQADGYRPLALPARRDAGQVIELIPNVVYGVVTDDSSGEAIPRATVRAGVSQSTSGTDGRFTLEGVNSSPHVDVAAPGYERVTLEIGDQIDVTVRLRPRELRGAYLTFYGVADPDIRGHVVDMLSTRELNALVLDVKGDLGYVVYRSNVPLANIIGANDIIPLPDPDLFIAQMKQQGTYLIARIVVFKDDLLARNGLRAGLDVAVRDDVTEGRWQDLEGLGWVDPFREEVWDYNISLAEEAIAMGFDEVQFDYVRFPTDPAAATRLDRASFSVPSTDESRPAAITEFLRRARVAVHRGSGALSADIFGYVCWREDDLGIGQQLEMLAGVLDYISPMVYPSTFNGLPMDPSYAESPRYPYETVYYSLEQARQRLAGTGVAIRPWLQYFDDYPWVSGMRYGPAELEAQRRAVSELRLPGYMWWDPTNLYRYGSATPVR
ncbi:MAG: hypothetical protein HW416_766 [Chloroflexi bacterium]|nr:hypothetical protein [Chloroflexota bacterium]